MSNNNILNDDSESEEYSEETEDSVKEVVIENPKKRKHKKNKSKKKKCKKQKIIDNPKNASKIKPVPHKARKVKPQTSELIHSDSDDDESGPNDIYYLTPTVPVTPSTVQSVEQLYKPSIFGTQISTQFGKQIPTQSTQAQKIQSLCKSRLIRNTIISLIAFIIGVFIFYTFVKYRHSNEEIKKISVEDIKENNPLDKEAEKVFRFSPRITGGTKKQNIVKKSTPSSKIIRGKNGKFIRRT
jgi:hypothetical protein